MYMHASTFDANMTKGLNLQADDPQPVSVPSRLSLTSLQGAAHEEPVCGCGPS